MTEEVTLAQLAAEVAQLRQQLEAVNQRLDMIYGAVTRLADQPSPTRPAPSRPKAAPQTGPALSPVDMMSPGSMLDALHKHATNLGLDVSTEAVGRLKGQTEPDSTPGEEPAVSG